jgi:hypothetical protein
MSPSLTSRLRAWGFSLFPAYFGTGARVIAISDGWRVVRIRLPLTWRTRNYVGTLYGGSLYGSVDPFYMMMLIKNLGPDYIVWDKAAAIQFKRPGRTTLYAQFTLEASELEAIRAALEHARSIERVYAVDLTDAQGVVHATVEKTLYIRRKSTVAPPAGSALVPADRSRER